VQDQKEKNYNKGGGLLKINDITSRRESKKEELYKIK